MAAPQDAGSIYSEVRIALDKLSGDIKKTQAKFDQLGNGVEQNTKKTTKKMDSLFSAFNISAVAAIGAVTLAFKKAISTFADTEQALANVKAVSGATEEEFKLLSDAASEAGTTTRFTAGQAADALYALASAGLDATQAVGALDGVLTLAGATQSDLKFTSETLTATLSQFSLEAEDAADVSNIFAAAIGNSQANMEKLAGALRQVGPIAGTLGIGLEEVTGSLQALFNAGFRGEAAGVALRNALGDLSDETSTAVKELAEYGLTADDVNPKVVGLTGAIAAINDAGVEATDAIRIFGKESGPQLATLLQVGEDGLIEYTEAVTGTSAATQQYAIQNDTLAGSFDSLQSAIEGTGNVFVGKFSPYLREVVDITTDLTRLLGKQGKEADATGKKWLKFAANLLNPISAIKTITVESTKWLLNLSRGNREQRAAIETIREYTGSLDDLADKTGISAEQIEKLYDEVAQELKISEGFEDIEVTVSRLSEELGFSRDQIIEIGSKSELISGEYKEQLSSMKSLVDEQTVYNQQISATDRIAQSLANAQAELARRKAEESRIAIELARQEEERASILKTITGIRELEARGLISTEESLERQIEFRESLLDNYKEQAIAEGTLSDEISRNITEQESFLKDLYTSQTSLAKDANDETVDIVEDALLQERISRGEAQNDYVESLVYQTEKEAEELEKRRQFQQSYFNNVAGLAASFFDSLAQLNAALAEKEIAAIESVRDSDIAAIDERTNAKLESLGLLEETEIQKLQNELEAAKQAGDTELENELQKELDRTIILDDAAKQKAAIEEQAQRDIAEARYQSDKAQWVLGLASSQAQAAQAIITASTSAPWPYNLIPIGIQSALNVAQLAAYSAAKPQAPSFATGGIVLPSGGTGSMVNVAENGNPEYLFNTGSSGDPFINKMGAAIAREITNAGGGPMVIQVIMNDRTIAESSARYYNNGQVKVKLK